MNQLSLPSPKRLRQAVIVIASVALIAFLSSCSTTYAIKLSYRAIKPSADAAQQIAIGEVQNLRPDKKGGDKDYVIGTLRGGYGNPFPLNTKGKVEVTQFFKELLNDAAKESGLDVVPVGNAPQLALDIHTFWCDGVMGYKINISADLKLLSADGQAVLAKKTIEYGDGFVIVWSVNEVAGHYKRFLTRMLTEVETALKSDEFATAL